MLQKATEFVEIGKTCKMHGMRGMHKGFWCGSHMKGLFRRTNSRWTASVV
jgi:hypothetical protein